MFAAQRPWDCRQGALCGVKMSLMVPSERRQQGHVPGPRRRIALRLPEPVADMVEQRAATVGVSKNEWLVRAVQWALAQPVSERPRQVVEAFRV